MAAHNVYCHVLNREVGIISSEDGTVTRVACPSYLKLTGLCKEKGGEKRRLVKSIFKLWADKKVGTRYVLCEFI